MSVIVPLRWLLLQARPESPSCTSQIDPLPHSCGVDEETEADRVCGRGFKAAQPAEACSAVGTGDSSVLHLWTERRLPSPFLCCEAAGVAEPAAVRVSGGQASGGTSEGGGWKAGKAARRRRRGVAERWPRRAPVCRAAGCARPSPVGVRGWASGAPRRTQSGLGWCRRLGRRRGPGRRGGSCGGCRGAAGAGARTAPSGGARPCGLPVPLPAARLRDAPPAASPGFRPASLCLGFAAASPDARSQFHGLWARRGAGIVNPRVRGGGRRVLAGTGLPADRGDQERSQRGCVCPERTWVRSCCRQSWARTGDPLPLLLPPLLLRGPP
ncbi:uncharacterized protein LOC123653059 [Pipistrellus kuhlii]|uniref:uncharacterized protein LOC123653059 n=1 Tax=Pipistrellus kuhlii TaxID=59472 RepID=UPI001E274005|nr:uncharacterized protein LOC123653059 [Pipistrellus kuhlii]